MQTKEALRVKLAALALKPKAPPMVQVNPAARTQLQKLQDKLAALSNTAPAPATAKVSTSTISANTPPEINTTPAPIPHTYTKLIPKAITASDITTLLDKLKTIEPVSSTTQAQMLAEQTTALKSVELEHEGTGTARRNIIWNTEQLAAIELARGGKSFAFIGSAGTGKTTTEREIVRTLSDMLCAELGADTEKFQPAAYIVVCAFTRRAVRNTYKALSVLGPKYTNCCKTVHKALEYKPVFEECMTDEGTFYNKRTFQPHVTKETPNKDVRIVLVDEASMLGYNVLYRQLREGFPNAVFVFIGDLNQLRPVMDDPTLAYALACLPVVELITPYRQALDSPIVEFQYTFTLKGKVPNMLQLNAYNKDKKGLHFQAFSWPKLQDTGRYNQLFVQHFIAPSFKAGTYNPDDSVILIPYNKAGTFGATDLNIEIAEMLGKARKAIVYEVIAGYHKRYFAIGDYVLFERRECEIVDIAFNSNYHGIETLQPSEFLSRHGYYTDSVGEVHEDIFNLATVGSINLEHLAKQSMDVSKDDEEDESATRTASHTITVKDRETGEVDAINVNKDIMDIDFSYAMTVHKSQGSEWRKVYFIAHECHRNLSRELLYTGMTRAREELVVFYSKGMSTGTNLDNSSLARAINRQEIPGRTWQEKASVYKMKMNNGDADAELHMDDWPQD